jgi:GTP-binding protein HflX
VIVTDTVGFLHRLPHGLIASFRSTLDEARDADVIVHVVDASDPAFRTQRATTLAVLHEIGARAPVWLVLNKIDRVDAAGRAALADELAEATQMSALDERDVRALRVRIEREARSVLAGR